MSIYRYRIYTIYFKLSLVVDLGNEIDWDGFSWVARDYGITADGENVFSHGCKRENRKRV